MKLKRTAINQNHEMDQNAEIGNWPRIFLWINPEERCHSHFKQNIQSIEKGKHPNHFINKSGDLV